MIHMVYASNAAEESTRIFESEEALPRFKKEFEDTMQRVLAEQREARVQSEEDTHRKRVF